MELVKHEHPNLLLFEAVEQGKNQGIIDDSFVQNLREEGVAMTIGFAQKHYSPHYEEVLRWARDIVIGVCNLGLVLTVGQDVKKAIDILLRGRLLESFRYGFSALMRLEGQTQVYDIKSKRYDILACCREVSHEIGTVWTGYERYLSIQEDARKEIARQRFVCDFLGCEHVRDSEADVQTKFLSSILSSDLVSKISLTDCAAIAEILHDQSGQFLLQGRFSYVVNALAPEYRDAAWKFAEDLANRINDWKKYAPTSESLVVVLLRELSFLDDIDDIVRFEAEAMEESSKDALIERIDVCSSGEDVTPIVKVLLTRSLNVDELKIAIDNVRNLSEIQGHVRWEKFSQEDIADVFRSLDHDERFATLVSEWARYICCKFHGDTAWGRSLCREMISVLIQCDADTVWNLSQNMAISLEQLSDSDSVGLLPFLFEGRDIFEFYMNSRAGDESRIFNVYYAVVGEQKDKVKSCLTHLLRTIIYWMKKDGIKKTDAVYHDELLREHFTASQSEKMIKFIFHG